MKKTFLLTALAFAMIAAIPARAQGGCSDSPENPTLILAGLAGGAYAISNVRMKIRARRAAKTR
ncbi:MAG: PExPT-CTERM protein [Acidobacteriaceae bacterium]|jgi:XrtJ-associated TM-motif-TM protein